MMNRTELLQDSSQFHKTLFDSIINDFKNRNKALGFPEGTKSAIN